MADKKVEIEVTTEAKLEKVKALEAEINKIKKEKIELDIQAKSEQLQATETRIKNLKTFLDTVNTGNTNIHIDDSEIQKAEEELAQLESNKIDLQLDVETSKLKAAEAEIEELDGKQINIDLQTSMQNIGQGISQARQAASELASNLNEVQQAGMQSEQNLAFLANNLPGGMTEAKEQMQQISQIVASMPGDDNTMRSVLSTAQALGNNLKPEEMQAAVGTMADYMQGSATMGKMAVESQQDIMKYLLDGNTAELERGSIVSAHVDKLKEASTFQERQAAMQEVLNELGYGGIAGLDTTINKQAEWEGMLYNSQVALSSMWLDAEKGAMDYIIKLNDATGGILGMGIAAAQTIGGPLVELMSGIGQVATGLRGLKDAADWAGIADKLSPLKDALTGVTDTAKKAADALLDAGRKALTAGANAVRSAAMWVAEKAAKIASTAASYALSAAQAVLNFVMSLNPIVLVAIALVALVAALIWAYNNVDWFREMVDNAWASLQQFAGFIMGVLSGAVQWLGDAFNNAGQSLQDAFNGAVEWVMTSLQGLYEYIMTLGGLIPEGVNITGNQIIDSIIAVLTFLATLPVQLSIIFLNMIAQALGFGQNFSQRMFTNAMNAVNGFVQWMSTLPSRAYTYLSTFLSRVISWGASIASNFLSAATKSVTNFANQIAQIPSKLGTELSNALNKVNEWAATLPAKFWEAGVNAVKNFLSALGIASPGTMQRMLVWEVTEMGKRVPEESKQLLTNVSRLGENIVDEFGEPTLGVNFDDTANASFTALSETSSNRLPTINLNLEIGSVDNEDRVQEIVEVIRRELNWNNLTAGRDV